MGRSLKRKRATPSYVLTPARFIREPIANVSNEQAKAWIEEFKDILEIEIARCFVKFGRQDRAMTMSDMRQIGSIAIIEACVLYRCDNDKKCSLRTWVSRVVRWRLMELCFAVFRLETREVPLSRIGLRL